MATDKRNWTLAHYHAQQGKVPRPMIHALTPPHSSHHFMPGVNIDTPGPGGITPLHVASMAGGGNELIQQASCHGGVDWVTPSAATIQDLVDGGANTGVRTDFSGETPLHMAARYSRADAAKKLLDAGADPTVQDNTGRTPLHAAIAADARGVFQILMNHRIAQSTVNVSMNDGVTPLMTAVKLELEEIVEELLANKVDINATDSHGKSALHWAAAVDNPKAANLLIRHGANVDAQDERNQTPLYLAAREGSYEVARLLLLQGNANSDLPDHMDNLPYHIAKDRQHMDIVQLIEKCGHGAVGGAGMQAMHPYSLAQQQQHPCAPGMLPGSLLPAAKGRSKKPSSAQRKPSARSVNSDADREDDVLLRASRQTAGVPPDQFGVDCAGMPPTASLQKKPKRRRPPPPAPGLAAAINQQQLAYAQKSAAAAAAEACGGSPPEQPPPYEHAVNGRRFMYLQQNGDVTSSAAAATEMCGPTRAMQFRDDGRSTASEQFCAAMNGGVDGLCVVATTPVRPGADGQHVMMRSGDPMMSLDASALCGGAQMQQQQQYVYMTPHGGGGGIPIPGADNGGASPMQQQAGRKSHRSQPLSPVHQQMLQQRLRQQQQQQQATQGYDVTCGGGAMQSTSQPTSCSSVDATLFSSSAAVPGSSQMFQYPTPPSHHSIIDPTSPSQSVPQNALAYPNGYPTPSPDASPGQWSSSSPHSAKSDWSDRARNSSPLRATANPMAGPGIKNEPVYL